MNEDIIRVTGLSKSFSSNKDQVPFWALSDISFSLKQGDLLAIIGKNGSGKSTLLKILSEIYKPTTGKAVINGRVASVLDIGTGFHPDLTGRENIFFYGALTGFGQSELNSKFEEIVDLSGLNTFIDTPLRNYSSGMFVRLAVSVILCLHYDILILDEVIGAGDSEFKLKMADRVKKLVENGTTILMASHNINELFNCNAVLWLESGCIKKFSYDKNALIEYMEQTIEAHRFAQIAKEDDKIGNIVRKEIDYGGIKLNSIEFTDKDHVPKSVFSYDEQIYLQLRATVLQPDVIFPFEFGVFDALSNLLFGTTYQAYNPHFKTHSAGDKIQFTAVLPKHFFNQGTYFINIYGLDTDGRYRDLGKNMISFMVVANSKTVYAPRGNFVAGLVRPQINWEIARDSTPAVK
jgi:lipopolysaccharide transport system ATP-binding protein